jgi:hypothetical protein
MTKVRALVVVCSLLVRLAYCKDAWRNAPASPDGVSDQPDGADAALSGTDPATGEALPPAGGPPVLVIMIVILLLVCACVTIGGVFYLDKAQEIPVTPTGLELAKQREKYKQRGKKVTSVISEVIPVKKHKGPLRLGERLAVVGPTEHQIREEMIQTRVNSLLCAHSKLFGVDLAAAERKSRFGNLPAIMPAQAVALEQAPLQAPEEENDGEKVLAIEQQKVAGGEGRGGQDKEGIASEIKLATGAGVEEMIEGAATSAVLSPVTSIVISDVTPPP